MTDTLSTAPYKGTRDFYPDDMAVERYIFDTWAHVAESFGFERYDASILEPATLYRSKTSEEIVNDQTYTFTDRGEREVTLRPEMTPTVARMIAAKRNELSFPVRWYSIPNLFRYERPQKGRLREHWQLNCDIFGSHDIAADIEIISLASRILLAFGADPDMFEIRINDRSWMNQKLKAYGLTEDQTSAMLALIDRKDKIHNFNEEAEKIAGKDISLDFAEPEENSRLSKIIEGLGALGVTNVVFSPTTVRGFLYYTGTIFEIFDVSGENNRALLGGGRYDNLTSVFGGDPIPGVGFGMGDVTMRDFLETHNLLTAEITSPTLAILPLSPEFNIEAEKVAQQFRNEGISVSVDLSDRKIGKKVGAASDALIGYVLVLGEDEAVKKRYLLKDLMAETETSGTIDELVKIMK